MHTNTAREICTQIAAIDINLGILRQAWIDAEQGKKPTWYDRIDTALAERSDLMKKRDQATQPAAPPEKTRDLSFGCR